MKNNWAMEGTEDYKKINNTYPIKVSSHIEEIIDNEPVRIQFYPQKEELFEDNGIGAYFPEEKHLTSILVSKYPNRCMIYTTGKCFAHCRHCSRKEEWKKNIIFSEYKFTEACNYIKNHSRFEEVILTGGDFLCNTDEQIKFMLETITQIKHIRVVRIGTRCFTSNPERITDELCEIVKKFPRVVVCTQFNSEFEFTEKSINALRKIQRLGIPVLNQAVLLKGVNDTVEKLRNLVLKCVENRVIPYYLFHCFNVKGVRHLRTDPKSGIELTHGLVGNIGGWWIPRYVIIPTETGIKVPLYPNGLITINDDNTLTVKDFKERTIIYD